MSREKRDKREQEYPVQLESQFILRMPEEPGKVLGELIKSGENFKSRCTIQIHDDLRHGELRLDHWLLQAKIVDLPTIVESWKTIDKKSLYKSADICQMMICKDKFEEVIEDESAKNKKKDPFKVEKKYLWPHGVTPPTKNVRKRRFRKTLKKKSAEAPEIEKEVKRLLRADNEALSFTWEVIGEEDDTPKSEPNFSQSDSQMTFTKTTKGKKEKLKKISISNQTSKEEDIFGGTLSDSDVEEDNGNIGIVDRQLSHKQTTHIKSAKDLKIEDLKVLKPTKSEILRLNKKKASSHTSHAIDPIAYSELDNSGPHQHMDSAQLNTKLQEIVFELEELKQRKQRTQLEISRMENMTLRQRFQELLKTLNKEINMKEMEYNNLKSDLA